MRSSNPGKQKPGARIYKAKPTPASQSAPATGAPPVAAAGQTVYQASAGQSAAVRAGQPATPGTVARQAGPGIAQAAAPTGATPQAGAMGQSSIPSAQPHAPAQNGSPAAAAAPAGAPKAAAPYRAAGAPAYPHRVANAKKPGGFAGFFRDKKKLGITIAALVVVLVVLVVVVLALPRAEAPPTVDSSAGTVSSVVSASVEDYDKDANSLPEEAFIGTILPESEDAGVAYIEETLFLGDSNTVRMMAYRDITHVTLDNCIGVESMGITQFSTLKCARFVGMPGTYTMPEAMAIMKPRRVVITFGTNNIGMGVDTFIGFYRTAIEAARQSYEYADIIIGAVPPLDQIHQGTALSMTSVDQFNVALAALAEEMGCKFLNWTEALKNPNTGFCQTNYTLSDGVHITREGMEAMFTYFRTHAWISEDRRPKPLGTIPQQDGSMSDIITKDISSKAASSSSKASTVTVVVSAGTGGTLSVGGSASYTLAIGEGLSSITAIADDGYAFAQWAVSLGSIPDPYSTTLSGFMVPGSATAGSTITITASFTQVESSSSQSEPQSVSSSSEISSSSIPEESSSDPVVSSVPETPVSEPPVASVPETPVSVAPETPVDPVPPAEDPPAPNPEENQPAADDPGAQPGEADPA